jgi:anti-sigma factor RsiW
MSERYGDMSDEALSQVLAARLPRYPAPARLRAAVQEALGAAPRPAAAWWLSPALAAAGTALALALFLVPLLPRTAPLDPVERLVRSVVSEHTRAVLWGVRRPDVIPAALPQLTQESGIALTRFFVGDEHLSLVAAEPVLLEQRRGLALHYQSEEGRRLTYIVLPAPGLPMPERRRVQVDRWRPALLEEGGFSVLLWKHGELACFLVSDLVSEGDLPQLKDYFARVRASTEPVPAN